jgi:hypothetical protein
VNTQQQPKAPKTVAILQSNYIPWKGYFDLLRRVDEFILFDSMQFTQRDWRNRNKIKTKDGLRWLTIPVHVKGKYYQKINETTVSDPRWAEEHSKTLRLTYGRAPCFAEYAGPIASLYRRAGELRHLSRINHLFLTELGALLGITTRITWDTDYPAFEGKTERLVGLCQAAGATAYLSGPAARDYIVPELFDRAGVELRWMDYTGYPEYPQLHPPFEHGVSVLDLIFNVGPQAARYLERVRTP